jgi:hypothetical protein
MQWSANLPAGRQVSPLGQFVKLSNQVLLSGRQKYRIQHHHPNMSMVTANVIF